MALIDNLVSYWKMDEASGNRADSHGSNTLTVNGTGGVGSAAGIINNGADLERTDSDYLSITDAAQSGLDIAGSLSISMWINLESLPASGEIYGLMSKYGTGTTRGTPSFYYDNAAGIRRFVYSSSSTLTTQTNCIITQSLSTATWYHVVVTQNTGSSVVTIYVNGSSIGTGSGTASNVNNSVDFEIGTATSASFFFDGIIDEVGIWNKVLTSTEVTDLYNAGAGLAYPFSGTALNSGFFNFF